MAPSPRRPVGTPALVVEPARLRRARLAGLARLGSAALLVALEVVNACVPSRALVAAAGPAPAGGTAVVWGENFYGQLGDGKSDCDSRDGSGRGTHGYIDDMDPAFSKGSPCTNPLAPRPVSLPPQTRVTDVAAGPGHMLAVTADSPPRVFGWGYDSAGELGSSPASLAARTSGHCSGGNSCSSTCYHTCLATPTEIPLPPGSVPAQVAAGRNFSLALTTGGKVLAWGTNDGGELGNGAIASVEQSASGIRTAPHPAPQLVRFPAGAPRITNIAAGEVHSLALDAQGTVWSWGTDESGQSGPNPQQTIPEPPDFHSISPPYVKPSPATVSIPGAALPIRAIAAGSQVSYALDSGGVVWAWGSNPFGELGNGQTCQRTVNGTETGVCRSFLPVRVSLPAGTMITAIGAGIALSATGDGYAWGDREDYALGDGSTCSRETSAPCVAQTTPVRISLAALASPARYVAVAPGRALTSDGHVYAWGPFPGNGPCADPSHPQTAGSYCACPATACSSTPHLINELSNVTRIASNPGSRDTAVIVRTALAPTPSPNPSRGGWVVVAVTAASVSVGLLVALRWRHRRSRGVRGLPAWRRP